MKLTCYALDPKAPTLRPAPATRPWMDRVYDNHAYRCLPLSIANAHGWEVLAQFGFTASWSGDPYPHALVLRAEDGSVPPLNRVASHFGYGIVTFHLQYLFRTEPGWNLFAGGPPNRPKDGVAPLTGVVEADWLAFPFTMNWQMTRPGRVRFERDEPICFIFPVARGTLEQVEPEIVAIDDDPELARQVRDVQERRTQLMRDLAETPRKLKDSWLRDYFVGRASDGTSVPDHQVKLKLATPLDRRKSE